MIRYRNILGIFIAGLVPTMAFGQITIELSATREIAEPIVRIADIGEVSGGELLERRQIEQMDLLRMESDQPNAKVTRRQVEMRILLAGVAPSTFQVQGADEVRIQLVEPLTPDKRVIQVLLPEIAQQLDVPPEDVQLRIARPIAGNAMPYLQDPNLTLEPRLSRNVRPGFMTARIAVLEGARLVRTLPISLELQVYQDVALVTRDILPGETLSSDDLVTARRLISDRDQVAPISALLGRSLRVAKLQDDIVRLKDLRRYKQTRKEIVIRSRDVVEIVARSRTLEARVTGAIALQPGAVGDSIRVQNPAASRETKAIVARVVSAGLVEIRL